MNSIPLKPQLKENIWHIYPQSESSYLSTISETYEIPYAATQAFLQMRSHCTGHNTIAEIAYRSSLDPEAVQQLLQSMAPSGILCDPSSNNELPPVELIRAHLVTICKLWGQELTRGYIGNQFADGSLPRSTLVGWLVEMYHYIKDFPEAIRHAEEQAEGELKNLLHEYARQETGHEEFVLRTLEGIGLTREEVANATPLVSTRAVSFMMRSLADLHPSSMLLMAALVEAQDFDETVIEKFTSTLEANYGIARQVFKPYFDHQRIDVEMGHAKLLQENLSLVDIGTQPLLDRVINDLHDLKHSFELQGQEIKQYYGENLNGRYVPRQPMYFDSIS